MSCESSEPEDDGGDDEFGSPVGEAFGVAGGEVAELLEPGEASLDHVAVAVDVGIEVGWAATGGAFGCRRAIWSERSGQVKRSARARNAERVEGCE